jgi:uncharacterized protein YjiS (DUF1127 family)
MEHASDLIRFAKPQPGLGIRLVIATAWVSRVFRTLRERRQLMALDTQTLKDLGLSRADAYGEWSRPFWDLPRER